MHHMTVQMKDAYVFACVYVLVCVVQECVCVDMYVSSDL